jgi:hypothetical protein
MSFYDEHPPVVTRRSKNVKILRLVSPIVSLVMFGIIMYASGLRPHLSEPFFDVGNIVTIVFGVVIIYNLLHIEWIDKKNSKEEYLEKYGTKIDGTITKLSSLPVRKMEIQFNGMAHDYKITSEDVKKYKLNQKLKISYNPENPEEFVIIEGIKRYLQTLDEHKH